MNAQRRKYIMKAIGMVADARSYLEEALQEEQEAFDNMPENLQYSERGERMEECIARLEDMVSYCEDIESWEEEGY